MESDRITLFYTMTDVFRAEKLFKNKGYKVRIVPVPRHLSSDCGVAMVVCEISEDLIARHLVEAGLCYAGTFKHTDETD